MPLAATSPWTLHRLRWPAGLTITASRSPQVGQKRGGSCWGWRQPGHSAVGRPHPSQWAGPCTTAR